MKILNRKTVATLSTLAAISLLRMALNQSSDPLNQSPKSVAIATESEPVQEVESPTPEPVETEAEQEVQPKPKSQFSYEAELTYSALKRQFQASGYAYSKLTREELNELCWENRNHVQELQDRFGGGVNIPPSELRNSVPTLISDLECRLAFHYKETNSAPNFSLSDISQLEGIPNDPKEE